MNKPEVWKGRCRFCGRESNVTRDPEAGTNTGPQNCPHCGRAFQFDLTGRAFQFDLTGRAQSGEAKAPAVETKTAKSKGARKTKK